MIIISTQCFPPVLGGIESLMHSLAYTLHSCGQQVVVFADRESREDGQFDRQQPYVVYRHGGLKPWRRRKKAWALHRMADNATGGRRVLITDSWKSLEHANTDPFSAVLCLAHGTEIPAQPSANKLRRIRGAFAKAGYVIPNSRYTAGLIQPCLADARKLRVILPGITRAVVDDVVEDRVRTRLAGHDPVLITLARLEPRKGHASVIRLLPRLIAEFPALLYVIAGEGPDKPALETAVTAAGLQSHVLFTGRIEGPEKTAWLKNSSLFIMPGRQIGQDVEGFGLAYIDAALQGVPAIACKVGGAPEAVLHRQTGLVCTPEDEEKLARVTLELLRNRPYLQQLGINARARADGFLWDKKINEYLELFED